jgi:hypothetical protein
MPFLTDDAINFLDGKCAKVVVRDDGKTHAIQESLSERFSTCASETSILIGLVILASLLTWDADSALLENVFALRIPNYGADGHLLVSSDNESCCRSRW